MPVEVEVLVASQASKLFGLAAQVTLHLVQRLGRIDHRIAAAVLHPLDLLKDLVEFIFGEANESPFAKTQVTALQIGERVAEGAALKTQGF